MKLSQLLLVAILLNLINLFAQASGHVISCEKVEVIHWIHIYDQRVCVMAQGTTIDSDDSIIQQSDQSISALWINSSKNIWFLPVRVSETYPNLVGYAANSCSISTISKKNFEGLSKVKALWLSNNQIHKIPSTSFDDLVSLEFLDLDQNRIKFMSGDLFKRLNNLEKVFLYENECISKNFEDQTSLRVLADTVTELCGSSYEPEEIHDSPSAEPLLQVTREDFERIISLQLVHQSYIQTLVERNTLQESRITNLESKTKSLDATGKGSIEDRPEMTLETREQLESEIGTLKTENNRFLHEIESLKGQLKTAEDINFRH